jgi:hypothetical protein
MRIVRDVSAVHPGVRSPADSGDLAAERDGLGWVFAKPIMRAQIAELAPRRRLATGHPLLHESDNPHLPDTFPPMPILHWLTRDDDIRVASEVPYRLLEEVPELGYGDRNAGNMLIQGDNLGALKSLLPFYAGQVKCIYIDPPYNTRSAFEHYDDNLEHTKWPTGAGSTERMDGCIG